MGVGPIPFSSIYEYATIYEVEDFEEFRFVIRQMDDAYLEEQAKKNDTKASTPNHSKSGRKGR